MGERRDAYRVVVARPEGNRPLGRSRRRWKIILKWIFKTLEEEAWTGLKWI